MRAKRDPIFAKKNCLVGGILLPPQRGIGLIQRVNSICRVPSTCHNTGNDRNQSRSDKSKPFLILLKLELFIKIILRKINWYI